MDDPTEVLDTLATRAAAEPIGEVPPRRELEAAMRARRRRHRMTRVGVAAVVLLAGGITWSTLRDSGSDPVIVTTLSGTPAAVGTAEPAPSQDTRGDATLLPLQGDACLEGIGAPRDAAVLLADLAEAAPPGTPIDRIQACTTPADIEWARLAPDRSSLTVRYLVGPPGCGELYSVVLAPDTSTVEVRTGRLINGCPDVMDTYEVVVEVPEALRGAAIESFGPSGAGPAVTTADALRALPALAPLARFAETDDVDGSWPAADEYYADWNPGNVAVRGRFVAAVEQVREWTAVHFAVAENLAGDPDAARPGDELVVMVFTGSRAEPASVGEQLARIDDVILFLYRDLALFPEHQGAFVIDDNVFLGAVDEDGFVRFPFAEGAGWPEDSLPIAAIG